MKAIELSGLEGFKSLRGLPTLKAEAGRKSNPDRSDGSRNQLCGAEYFLESLTIN